MAAQFDIVIRGDTAMDGNGGTPYLGDAAVTGGAIAEEGRVSGRGRQEIDALSLSVTPGLGWVGNTCKKSGHKGIAGQGPSWQQRLALQSNSLAGLGIGSAADNSQVCRNGSADSRKNARNSIRIAHSPRDCHKFWGHAATATGGCGSLAGWNFCPKSEPRLPL
jgi:hypothetical protein